MNHSVFNPDLRRTDRLPQTEEIDLFVSDALRYLIQHVFRNIANSFVVTISSSGTPAEFWFHYIMAKLFATWGFMAVQLVVHDSKNKDVYVPGRRYCNMIMVDSFESLDRSNIAKYNRKFDSMEYYFIFLQIRDSLMIVNREKILKYCLDNYWLHCNVMVQNSLGEVLVYTYFPFRPSGCYHTDPVLINQFNGERFVNNQMFPDKLKNLHGCTLTLSTWHVPPFVIYRPNATVRLSGLEMVIVRSLSKYMNFTIDEHNTVGEESLDTNRIEAFELLSYRGTNLTAGFFRRTSERDTAATPTYVTYYLPLVAVLLRRENQYQSIEILTFPFDLWSWTLLIISTISLFVITSIKHKFKESLNSWHIIESLLGVPTCRVPKGLSYRAIFIIWILSALILRSVYQSLLFYLFRTQFYRDPPSTFAELAHYGYTVVCSLRSEPLLQHIPQLRNKSLPLIVLNTSNEMEPLRYLDQNSDQNIVSISVVDFTYYYVQRVRQETNALILLSNSINSQQIGFYLPKHSYLIDRFNDFILGFHQNGFMSVWRARSLASYRVTRTSHTKDYEQPLLVDMKQFFGFMSVLLFLDCIAAIIFALELLSKKVKLLQRIF